MKTHPFLTLLLAAFPVLGWAQNYSQLPDSKKGPTVILPGQNIYVHAFGGMSVLPVLSNTDYQIAPVRNEGETPWFYLTRTPNGQLKIKTDYWYKTTSRKGKFTVSLNNGKVREINLIQAGNDGINCISGDKKIPVYSGEASSVNKTSQGIEMTFDGDKNTFYHSKWQGGSTQFPVTLTYHFEGAPHIDHFVYTPRTNHTNGRFGKVTVSYCTNEDPHFTEIIPMHDFKFTGDPTTIALGDQGIDQVKSIRFTVKTGQYNFVSCAEMEFFGKSASELEEADKVFTNSLCYALKPEVGEKEINQLANPYLKQLAYYLLKEGYDTRFRVGNFEPYETLESVARRQKNSAYNRYENPTGIYFPQGEKSVIFADGIDKKYPVKLIIKDWSNDSNQPASFYTLQNGINIITAENRGNSYVSYYTDDYRTAPTIQLHFAMGHVNGYFDLERGDTDEDWVKILDNACSDIMDIRTQRIQAAFPTARFKEYCPVRITDLAHNMDSTIYYEREVMGLAKYGIEPKNRQFARVIWDGPMHADGTGAAARDAQLFKWMKPDRADFEFWGFAHELGHVNQLRPGLKWVGCGETTNNIYSAWVEFKLGVGHYRLECEKSGMDDYSKIKGGRFNCYLEEGVRKGFPWQLQKGNDYKNVEEKKVTVPNVDYDGRPTGRDTTLVSVNYDHFVKLVPLWQLQLYCQQAEYSPDIYAKVCQAIRTTDESKMTDGQLQLKFIREVCDSSQLNFLPFFEKAGMLRPIRYYVQDYGPTWLNISTEMIDALKQQIADKGYPVPAGEINYINAFNWNTFKSQLPLHDAGLNAGCTPTTHIYDKREPAVPYVRVDHQVWKNAVAFETYNAEDQLIRISMYGLGSDDEETYTMVMFPEEAQYIMAVGWDGKRIKCYQR